MDRSLTPVLPPHLGRLGHSLGHSIYMVLLLYSLSVLVVLVTERERVKRDIENRYRAARCRTGCVALVTRSLPKIGKFVCAVQRLSVFSTWTGLGRVSWPLGQHGRWRGGGTDEQACGAFPTSRPPARPPRCEGGWPQSVACRDWPGTWQDRHHNGCRGGPAPAKPPGTMEGSPCTRVLRASTRRPKRSLMGPSEPIGGPGRVGHP
jgi:hypothetical protein